MINVSQVLASPLFSQPVTVQPQKGSYDLQGRWIKDTVQPAPYQIIGCVQRVTDKELNQLDLGDVVGEKRKVLTKTQLTGNTADSYSSDRIIWRSKRYRVIAVSDSSDYGFYRAIAVYEGDQS
jgi:hypothetical protein